MLTIIVNDAPYGIERAWNALRLASASASPEIGFKVNVFLMGDAVLAAKKKQRTPEGYYNIEKMLVSLLRKGVEVHTCGACINTRGLSPGDLVDGVEKGTMMGLARWVKESEKVLSF